MADRSLLARATESTQAPTPGYLYLDIAKNVSSSPMACSEVATYLTRRLSSKKNANIKHKCLKVIAKTAESPVTKGQFKRTLAQDSTAMGCIKEALQYRGPPDPARGDEPYLKVRVAAKEALDAIYSDTPTSSSMHQNANHHASVDYGAGAGGVGMSSGAGAGGAGARRMEGIGNPMFKDPRLQASSGPAPTTGEFLKEAGDTIVGMIRDPLARKIQGGEPSRSSSGMQGFGSHHPPGRSQLQQQTGGQWNMASNRGPEAVGQPANYGKDEGYYKQKQAYDWASKSGASAAGSASGVGGSWGNLSTGGPPSGGSVAGAARAPITFSDQQQRQPYVGMTPSAQQQTTGGQGGTAVSDGQFEKQLVLELCPPGGMKPEPPPDKLARFSQALPSLNPDLVCPVLLDCLEDGQPWIMKAKALCVMETCITLGVSEDGVNRYADFFYECRQEVAPLSNHNRSAIRNPATRVMELLGVATASGATTGAAAALPGAPPAAPSAAPPSAPPADLLDFGAATPPPPATVPPPPPTAAPPAPPAEASRSLFGGLTVQNKVPVVAAAQAAVRSMFDSMTVKTEPAVAPADAPASAFGFMQPAAPTEPAPPAAAPAGSAFGFMQDTPAIPEPVASAPAQAVTGGSSFDFLQQPAPLSPEKQGKATFDPLAQNYQASPTSQQRNVQQQINPAQLNAMYSQQNMMMMQQQMQQMQMAMAMQNQGKMPQRPMPQQPQRTGSNPNVMVPGGFAASASFSFLDAGGQVPKKKEDKSFDFVQDFVKNEKKK